jgi:hypothetical protein
MSALSGLPPIDKKSFTPEAEKARPGRPKIVAVGEGEQLPEASRGEIPIHRQYIGENGTQVKLDDEIDEIPELEMLSIDPLSDNDRAEDTAIRAVEPISTSQSTLDDIAAPFVFFDPFIEETLSEEFEPDEDAEPTELPTLAQTSDILGEEPEISQTLEFSEPDRDFVPTNRICVDDQGHATVLFDEHDEIPEEVASPTPTPDPNVFIDRFIEETTADEGDPDELTEQIPTPEPILPTEEPMDFDDSSGLSEPERDFVPINRRSVGENGQETVLVDENDEIPEDVIPPTPTPDPNVFVDPFVEETLSEETELDEMPEETPTQEPSPSEFIDSPDESQTSDLDRDFVPDNRRFVDMNGEETVLADENDEIPEDSASSTPDPHSIEQQFNEDEAELLENPLADEPVEISFIQNDDDQPVPPS